MSARYLTPSRDADRCRAVDEARSTAARDRFAAGDLARALAWEAEHPWPCVLQCVACGCWLRPGVECWNCANRAKRDARLARERAA